MDRYQKVEKPKPESPVNENEIRITSQGLVRNYLSYATTLLQERQVKEIVLKAMGQAISKTVAIAEFLKRRVPQLHQDTAISSISITDTFEPIEEGLQIVEQTRHVSMISITLSTKELNQSSPGYQGPSNADQTKQKYNNYKPQQQQHQPPRQALGVYNAGNVDQTKQQYNNYQPQQQNQPPRQARVFYNAGNGDTNGQGRGRGRGRGRGWYRGGYSNYQENDGHSGGYNGGYSNSGGYNGGYPNSGGYNGGYNGGYSNSGGYAGGYSNWGRGGSRGGWGGGYHGAGYGRGRGRGVGGRGYGGRGRGGMGGRATQRVGGNQE